MTELQEVNHIKRLTPVDVTGIADQGIRALVMYAVSMGWNFRQKGQAILTARNGHVITLPCDTSVRRHYVGSNLRQIMTHTEPDKRPTIDLVEQIMAAVKLTKEAEREFREITGVGFRPKRPKLPEPPPIPAFRNDGPKVPKTIVPPPPETLPDPPKPPLPPEPKPVPPVPPPGYKPTEVTVVSRELFKGKFHDPSAESTSYQVRYSDGTVKYECVICGEMFSDPRGIGGHRIGHIKRGETAPATAVSKRAHAGRDAVATLEQIAKAISPYLPTYADPEELESLRALIKSQEQVIADLTTQLHEVTEDRDRLRTNLTALRELLGDVG